MTGISTVLEVIGVEMVVQEDVAVVAIADDGDGVDGVYEYRCQRISLFVLQLSIPPAFVSNLSQGEGTSYDGFDRNHHRRRNSNGLLYGNPGRESLSRRVKKSSKMCH